MHFIERLFAAIRRVAESGRRRDRPSARGIAAGLPGSVPRDVRRASPTPSAVRRARSSTSSPPWSPRSSSSPRSMKPMARRSRRPARERRGGPGEGPDRDRRRQAQRHRLDRRGLCPCLPGQGPRRRTVRALVVRRCPDRQPLPRLRRHPALRPGRRPGAEGRVRPGPHQQCIGRRVPGPRGGRPAPLSPCRRSTPPVGRPSIVGESGYSLVGAVVGATYPGQLAELRAELPGIPLLVPGYGSQGGTSRDVAAAFDEDGLGALINNSRGITGAHDRPAYRDRFGDRWQAAVEQAVRDMIDDLAANTPAGRLRGVVAVQRPRAWNREWLEIEVGDAEGRPVRSPSHLGQGASLRGPMDHEGPRPHHRERDGQHEHDAPVVTAGEIGGLSVAGARRPPCSWGRPARLAIPGASSARRGRSSATRSDRSVSSCMDLETSRGSGENNLGPPDDRRPWLMYSIPGGPERQSPGRAAHS